MENPNCKTCIFAYHNYPMYSYEYECHRFPPTNTIKPDFIVNIIYPMVKPSDWCGEYKNKKEN